MMIRYGIALLSFGASVNAQLQGGGVVIDDDPTAPCTLCQNRDDPELNPTASFFRGSDQTCPDLVATLEALDTTQLTKECKDLQLFAFQIGCCSFPPWEYCDICPDGGEYDKTSIVPLGTPNDPTCEAIQYRSATLNGFYEAGTCDDTLLRRGAHHCKCPGVQNGCPLCPGGEPPGNPRRGDAFKTFSNCLGIDYTYSLFSAEECPSASTNFGVDFPAFCECPGVDQPEEKVCSVCPEGQKIKNPNEVWTDASDPFQRTCEQAETFATYVNRASACDEIMEKPRKVCKCSGASWNTLLSGLLAGVLVLKELFF